MPLQQYLPPRKARNYTETPSWICAAQAAKQLRSAPGKHAHAAVDILLSSSLQVQCVHLCRTNQVLQLVRPQATENGHRDVGSTVPRTSGQQAQHIAAFSPIKHWLQTATGSLQQDGSASRKHEPATTCLREHRCVHLQGCRVAKQKTSRARCGANDEPHLLKNDVVLKHLERAAARHPSNSACGTPPVACPFDRFKRWA